MGGIVIIILILFVLAMIGVFAIGLMMNRKGTKK